MFPAALLCLTVWCEVWTRRGGWKAGRVELQPGRDGHCSVGLGRQGFLVTGGWQVEST